MYISYIKKLRIFVFLILVAVPFLQSCEDQEVEGVPVISNVRLLDPALGVGALTEALPGTKIVIQGQNLGSVLKVYFNDFEASFNAALGSGSNLIVTIPANAPTKAVDPTVSNQIIVITTGGQVSYNFQLLSPQPRIDGLYSEFVKSNGELIIQGDYFYNITSVRLGDISLPITSTTVTEIKAKVPATVPVDFVIVEGEFGSDTTHFKLNDTAHVMIDLDVPATSWGSLVCWGGAAVIPATDPDAISGAFSRIKQVDLPKAGYDDSWVLSTCYFEFNLPAGRAEDRQFKFEHLVLETWKAGAYDFVIGAEGKEYTYTFKPWNTTVYLSTGYKTAGWKTAVIELTEFKNATGGTIADVSKITDLKIAFSTPDEPIATFNTSVDNFRIVNNK
jgi:hypothetical protein